MTKPTPRRTGLIKQAVKTAAAATISLYASRFLKLPEGYWAAISAIIVLQSNLEATFRTSVNRLAGTAIGSLLFGHLADRVGRLPAIQLAVLMFIATSICG